MIGRTITNLNTVLGTVDARDDQLSQLIDRAAALRQRALPGPRGDRRLADEHRRPGRVDVGAAQGRRPAIRDDVKQLGRVTGTLDDNKAVVDKFLKHLPNKLNTITRTATYGSWFNFYLCDFDGPGHPVQHGQLHAQLPLQPRRGASDARIRGR